MWSSTFSCGTCISLTHARRKSLTSVALSDLVSCSVSKIVHTCITEPTLRLILPNLNDIVPLKR
jgi:ribosomal protein S3AE